MQREIIKQIPKADLHRHFDGCIRPETIIEIAQEQNIQLPTYDIEKLKKIVMMTNDCQSLVEYLNAFNVILLVLKTPENLTRTMFECCEDAYNDGCTYAEFRFAPCLCEENTAMTFDDILDAVIKGIKKAEEMYNIKVRIIVCAMRHWSAEDAMKASQAAVKYKNNYVVGFDLAGPEFGYPADIHKDALEYAHDNGIHVTIHAGEADGSTSVEIAIENYAERIGHGVRMLENEETVKLVQEKNVVVECCLTSNIQTKAIDALETHPILTFMERGIICTINTDNTTVSSCDLSGEIELFQKIFKLTNKQMCELILNSFRAAFIENETLKNELIQYAEQKMKELSLY